MAQDPRRLRPAACAALAIEFDCRRRDRRADIRMIAETA
jgi:hypothetical protein